MKVTMITGENCHYCDDGKKFLRRHNIDFTELPSSAAPQLASGGVPVLIVDGTPLRGFSEAHWARALKISRLSSSRSNPSGVGATCDDRRVTPKNVLSMVATTAIGSQASETMIPIAGIAGAGLYFLGKRLCVCPIRAAGTGLLAGAAIAAIRHCVGHDIERGHLKF